MRLTGGSAAHTVGSRDRGWGKEQVLGLDPHNKIRSLVQSRRLVSEGLRTPSHRLSYHSSRRPPRAHPYGYTSHHRTRLRRGKLEESDASYDA